MPGSFMLRMPRPLTLAVKRLSPMIQSASAGAWPSRRCLTNEPKTSDIDSLSAPDCPLIDEIGWVGHAVGQFVTDNIHGDSEAD